MDTTSTHAALVVVPSPGQIQIERIPTKRPQSFEILVSPLYVGIDWADQHHDVVVIDEQGKQLDKKRTVHSAEGLEDLVRFLKSIGDVHQHADHRACIIETNSTSGILGAVEVEERERGAAKRHGRALCQTP
jgi:Transposase